MKKITVASLGPGSRDYLTLGTLEALRKAPRLVLRTGLCDAADYLREQGIAFETLDNLHESCEDFDALIDAAAARILALAEETPVCYAVLDAARDETVRRIREKAETDVLPGVPLEAPILAAADAPARIEIQTATSLEVTSTQNPLLILETDSRILAGQCKLQLLDWYDPSHPVLFFPPASGPRKAVPMSLEEIDRQKKYDHTCAVLVPALPLNEKKRFDFFDLVRLLRILRGENGCPWDKEQTHQSLRPYLIEEAYETAAAIDEEDWEHVADELGDVLLQIVFQADIARQYGTFALSDITTDICRKLMARHSHIFGGDSCETAEDVSRNWEAIKRKERGYTTPSQALTGVSKGLPPLMRAGKVQKRARDVGFDWDDPLAALPKVHEEADEVAEAIRQKDPAHIEEELGDLLFACVNVSRLSGVEAETALQKATEKFISRFILMENAIFRAGKRFEDLTLSEMDVYWNGSKQRPGP